MVGPIGRVTAAGLLVAAVTMGSGASGLANAATALFDNLGSLHHEISTTSPQAQQFFDQGLRLVFAFNHEEAVASFEEAIRLDADAPMPYWGLGLSLGPNINSAMDAKQEPRAAEALQKAASRLGRATPRERAYIEALSVRYSTKRGSSRRIKDEAYAKAMQAVARAYSADADALTLAAEALMNLRPWDYWRADGRPQPGTEEIVSTLQLALRVNPDHPGACHYYIHAVEASREPERAVDCAKRLASLMPGAGHLVHMPAHVFMRVGLYREASEHNSSAAAVDSDYLEHHGSRSTYAIGYYAHNLHFLNASLMMEGRSAEALRVAHDLLEKLSAWDTKDDPAGEFYAPTALMTLARFGHWSEIIREPPPARERRLTTGLWHFVRGLAFAATTRFGSAEGELSNLRKVMKVFAKAKTSEGKTSRSILKVAERVLVGELAARQGRYDAGIQALREAVRLETALPYSEPPFWYQPVRHNLGAVLMLAGLPAEAERVYREDLEINPENGWALQGLAQSLRAQHKQDDAERTDARFRTAWAGADVTLLTSRF
ncbi:MAG: hypothetical protein KF814_11455 [Nitrospiraceae bacterium]|nr:hypothetical protein [Nitrospiraceae bacterium]